MNWYEQNREKTQGIFEAIIAHDFIKDLLAGSLDKDIFGFYVNQDSLYLAEYKKALVSVGTKCHNAEDTQFFYESATGIITVEDALHKQFLEKKYMNPEPSPTCELYNSYLARIVANESVEVGAAAILPCFTIYKEVGDYILAHQSNNGANPYQTWIDTYASDEFAEAVNRAIDIVNTYAKDASEQSLKKMEVVFMKTSQLEWMFWDSAYKQEKWRI